LADYINVKFIRPAIFAVLGAVTAAALIFCIGELLLWAFDHSITEEARRKELWIGVGLALAILAVAGLLATRPAGALGPLDRPVAIGSAPISGVVTSSWRLGPVPRTAKYGAEGTISDLASGFTLYARNGALADVIDILQSVEDIGQVQRTLIYAKGLYGAQHELWIPIEAVSAVYPDTRSAFLAIGGDEIEHYGWHRPPASFVRAERPKETPLY
jgi:hypothetical protein